MKLTRYDQDELSDNPEKLRIYHDGEWVKYDDAQREIDRLAAVIERQRHTLWMMAQSFVDVARGDV